MENLAREKLIELVSAYGSGLADDPRRLDGLLKDVCGELRREIRVLVGAAEEHVPAQLLASKNALPRDVIIARLVQQLGDNLALSGDAAAWAVDSWALALGVASQAEIEQLETQRISTTVVPPPPVPVSQTTTPIAPPIAPVAPIPVASGGRRGVLLPAVAGLLVLLLIVGGVAFFALRPNHNNNSANTAAVTASPSPSPSPTPTPTAQGAVVATPTPAAPTATPSPSPTPSPTKTSTATPTPVPTTPSPTRTPSPTASVTATASTTATAPPTGTATTTTGSTAQPTDALTISTAPLAGSRAGSSIRLVIDSPLGPWQGQYVEVHKQKLDVQGNPVDDGGVASGKTDATGMLSFDLPPASYIVYADMPGYNWGTFPSAKGQANVAAVSGQQTTLTVHLSQLTMTAAAIDHAIGGQYFEVHLQKRDANNQIVQGDGVASGRTDNTGVWPTVLVPGHYIVQSDFNGYNWGDLKFANGLTDVILQPGKTDKIDIRPGRLIVTVRSNSGSVVNGAYVEIDVEKHDANGKPVAGNEFVAGRTDNTGIVAFDLTAGTYWVHTDAGDSADLKVENGQITTFSP